MSVGNPSNLAFSLFRPICVFLPESLPPTSEIIAAMGYALGGRPGERLMRKLGIPVSADTLIRQVKRAADLPAFVALY